MKDINLLLPDGFHTGLEHDVYKRNRFKIVTRSLKNFVGVITKDLEKIKDEEEMNIIELNIIHLTLLRTRSYELDKIKFMEQMSEIYDTQPKTRHIDGKKALKCQISVVEEGMKYE